MNTICLRDSLTVPAARRMFDLISRRLPSIVNDVIGDPQPEPHLVTAEEEDLRLDDSETQVQLNSRTYSVHAFLEHLATSPRSPQNVLERIMSHPQPHIRAAVAENCNAPQQMIWQLVQDEDPTVRYQLAENPHLPEDVLNCLAEDDNPYVACRAQRTLERLSQGN